MALLILVPAVAAIWAWWAVRNEQGRGTWAFYAGILGLFGGVFLAFLIGISAPSEWVMVETAKLASSRDTDGVSGQFFLGSGSIGTTQYYFFYKEVELGYRPGKVAAEGDNILIIEKERRDGELAVYKYRPIGLWKWITLRQDPIKFEFSIPTGTLKRGFVLR